MVRRNSKIPMNTENRLGVLVCSCARSLALCGTSCSRWLILFLNALRLVATIITSFGIIAQCAYSHEDQADDVAKGHKSLFPDFQHAGLQMICMTA